MALKLLQKNLFHELPRRLAEKKESLKGSGQLRKIRSGYRSIFSKRLDDIVWYEVLKLVHKIANRSCGIHFWRIDDVLIFLERQSNEPEKIEAWVNHIDHSNIVGSGASYKTWSAQETYDKRLDARKKKQEHHVWERFGGFMFFAYRNHLYCFDRPDPHTLEEKQLLVKEMYFKQEKKFLRMQKELQLFEKMQTMAFTSREPIPEEVRFFVWRRDRGQCPRCGSNQRLEFDHIIPVSQGGSNTERNIQLLCEKCNREKTDKI